MVVSFVGVRCANPPDLLGIDLRGALLAVERRRVGDERESVLGDRRARPNPVRIPDRSAFIAPVEVRVEHRVHHSPPQPDLNRVRLRHGMCYPAVAARSHPGDSPSSPPPATNRGAPVATPGASLVALARAGPSCSTRAASSSRVRATRGSIRRIVRFGPRGVGAAAAVGDDWVGRRRLWARRSAVHARGGVPEASGARTPSSAHALH